MTVYKGPEFYTELHESVSTDIPEILRWRNYLMNVEMKTWRRTNRKKKTVMLEKDNVKTTKI